MDSWPEIRVLELAPAFWQQTLQHEDTQQRLEHRLEQLAMIPGVPVEPAQQIELRRLRCVVGRRLQEVVQADQTTKAQVETGGPSMRWPAAPARSRRI
jgi:hypothetical protein